MTDATIAEKFAALFRRALSVDPPAPEVDLIASGFLDSLAIVSLLTELETVCGVRISLDRIDLPSIRTSRGLQDLIEGALRHGAQQTSVSVVD